jgi:hypothetical protein
MKKIQQEVLQWGIFEDLGKLDSSSRFYEEGAAIAPAESGLIHLANQGASYLAPY